MLCSPWQLEFVLTHCKFEGRVGRGGKEGGVMLRGMSLLCIGMLQLPQPHHIESVN